MIDRSGSPARISAGETFTLSHGTGGQRRGRRQCRPERRDLEIRAEPERRRAS